MQSLAGKFEFLQEHTEMTAQSTPSLGNGSFASSNHASAGGQEEGRCILCRNPKEQRGNFEGSAYSFTLPYSGNGGDGNYLEWASHDIAS